jgi:hypothetical protein
MQMRSMRSRQENGNESGDGDAASVIKVSYTVIDGVDETSTQNAKRSGVVSGQVSCHMDILLPEKHRFAAHLLSAAFACPLATPAAFGTFYNQEGRARTRDGGSGMRTPHGAER